MGLTIVTGNGGGDAVRNGRGQIPKLVSRLDDVDRRARRHEKKEDKGKLFTHHPPSCRSGPLMGKRPDHPGGAEDMSGEIGGGNAWPPPSDQNTNIS
jgi:hypothetical protein